MSEPRALITGVTGQDGSYLAELLLEKGYEVHGMVRRSSTESFERIAHLTPRLRLHQADLLDPSSLVSLLQTVRPAELYNLAAQSFVPTSWVQPSLTGEFTALGVTRMLEAVRQVDPRIRFYQASSSEMYGKVRETPQNENTPFYPRSPYGVAKVYGHHITVNYRESYGLYAVSGILFNHESPRRGREFVTRRISEGVARLKLGLQDELLLGNLDARRDWGYAPEYVRAMWQMLQPDEPGDYVIGTGEHHTPREFVEIAFAHVGLDPADFVRTDRALLRPAEVDSLLADPAKARGALGWQAETAFEELKSTAEELETTNEELHSTNEELETMNEELHSTNEELETINDELRQRTLDLDEVNAFLESILVSLHAGVVVLDDELRVRAWNDQAVDLWGLRPEEVQGQHFVSLDIGLELDGLLPMVRETLAGEQGERVTTVEATNRRGPRIDLRVSCSQLLSPTDEIRGVIVLMEPV